MIKRRMGHTLAVLVLLGALGMGCATVHVRPGEWTMERACKVILEKELGQLRGSVGNIVPEDLRCDENEFTDLYLTASHTTTRYEVGYTSYETTSYWSLRTIPFGDIESVYSRLDTGVLVIFPLSLGLLNPLHKSRIWIRMKNGPRYDLGPYNDRPMTIFPFWLIPSFALDEPLEGEAIEFLRQRKTGTGGETQSLKP